MPKDSLFWIKLDTRGVNKRLDAVPKKLNRPIELMAGIAQELSTTVDDNFEAQGRPRWTPHSPATKAKRPGGRILQDTRNLQSNIPTAFSSSEASISTNVPYAALHNFGGKAGRGRKVTYPARPFMPFNGDKLQPAAQIGIDEVIKVYLNTLHQKL